MAKLLNPEDFIKYLKCPCPKGGDLKISGKSVSCSECGKAYSFEDNILNFIKSDELESSKSRELKAHTYELSKEMIEHYANKERWSRFYDHFSEKKIRHLLNYFDRLNCREFFALGTGTGFELKKILSNRKFEAIYASDISNTALRIVPHSLSQFDIKCGLFTSDLDYCPIKTKEMPVLIYEAMHHTDDMHATIESLLKKGYRDVLFVEPTTNALVKLLAKLGLAEREEYSGLKPKWLDLGKLNELTRKYGYKSSIITMWDIPEGYFRKFYKKEGIVQDIFLSFVDIISGITNLFKFGSFSIVHLRKR